MRKGYIKPKELYDESVKKRLLNKVKIENECWLWEGCLNHVGYGQSSYRSKQMTVHRLSWKVFKGDFDSKLCVLHKCDNRNCINPEHLYLGNQCDNMQDAFDRGRKTTKRENHPRAKVTKELSKEIIQHRKSGMSQQKIGDLYGVSQGVISKVVLRLHWTTKN
jgi:hypothetical protein